MLYILYVLLVASQRKSICDLNKATDMYQLTHCQSKRFFAYKEAQYERRRNRIYKYCQSLDQSAKSDLMKIRSIFRIYVPNLENVKENRRLAFCGLAKVGSSTWMNHFKTIWRKRTNNPTLRLNSRGDPAFDYPKIKDQNEFADFMNNHVNSFVIVRNPLDRLASLYFNRLVNSEVNESQGWIRKESLSYFKNGNLQDLKMMENSLSEICEYNGKEKLKYSR